MKLVNNKLDSEIEKFKKTTDINKKASLIKKNIIPIIQQFAPLIGAASAVPLQKKQNQKLTNLVEKNGSILKLKFNLT